MADAGNHKETQPPRDRAHIANRPMWRRIACGSFSGKLKIFGIVALSFATAVAAEPTPIEQLTPGSGQSSQDCWSDAGKRLCGPEMVVVPAGAFMMGSATADMHGFDNERPQHRVTILRPFAIGKFTVTFAEWDACVAAGGCTWKPSDAGWGRDHQPVIDVSWNDAREYVAWLSAKTHAKYRLLTEAEWEYAARAGTTSNYWWGDEIGKGNAACNECGGPWDGKKPAPVGLFRANAFGLYDMSGNVWQWVEDCIVAYKIAPVDGTAASSLFCSRVIRGGSWGGNQVDLRSANRAAYSPGDRDSFSGFRVARDIAFARSQ